MNLAERLGEYALSVRYKDLDGRTVLEAKKRILDSIGCAVGAFGEKPVRAAKAVVEERGGGQSTVLGTRSKVSADGATFANGVMVRYFDYNDTYLSKEPAHPSDNLSACLAVGEREGCDGGDLLAALAVAYEVQCRLCDAADIRHRGWDHVCYGLVSTALAAGKLMGLSAERLAQAVNISLNAHIAMRQVRAGELSDWKGCSFANAARNAVFSADLARHGMDGPSPIFEGEMGFFKQVSGKFRLDTERFGGRGGHFKLPETYVKFFPAEYHAQSAIWAALGAKEDVESIDEIESVHVDTHEAGYTILAKDKAKWNPTTKETADHSLPYMVGIALLDGRVDNASYAPERFRDPRVLRFVSNISVSEDRSLTRAYPKHISNRVTLTLKGGRSISAKVDDPRGHPRNPMTKDEVEAKFRRLALDALGEERIRAVLDFVWNIDKKKDLSPLFEALVSAGLAGST